MLHTTTRVPVDHEYAAKVGKAVYVFAYYEWTIIWITEYLRPGFVAEYSRGKPMTSRPVHTRFQQVLDDPVTSFAKVTRQELSDCAAKFGDLIDRRNALIHAHPCTDTDGAQILTYQTKVTKTLPDMKWPITEVEKLIAEFDDAACGAGALLDRLRR